MTNLDLYLVPAGTGDIGENDIAISRSSDSPVEHIFTEIPATGEYEMWVFRNQNAAPITNYGLAWWYGLAPEISVPLSGDFDSDGDVDGQDFLAWQRDRSVGDLADWQANYGMSSLTAVAAVPEPGILSMLALSFCAWIVPKR